MIMTMCRNTTVEYVTRTARTSVACVNASEVSMARIVIVQKASTYSTADGMLYVSLTCMSDCYNSKCIVR